MCVEEFLLLSLCVVPPFPSTRGSSDSIAPRDRLQAGSRDMKRSLLPPHGPTNAGDKSGVRAEPSLIQHPQTLRTRTEGRSGVPRPQGVSSTVQKARTHSNTCLLPCLCADPFICSSMLIPCYMDTQKEDKEKV